VQIQNQPLEDFREGAHTLEVQQLSVGILACVLLVSKRVLVWLCGTLECRQWNREFVQYSFELEGEKSLSGRSFLLLNQKN